MIHARMSLRVSFESTDVLIGSRSRYAYESARPLINLRMDGENVLFVSYIRLLRDSDRLEKRN